MTTSRQDGYQYAGDFLLNSMEGDSAYAARLRELEVRGKRVANIRTLGGQGGCGDVGSYDAVREVWVKLEESLAA